MRCLNLNASIPRVQPSWSWLLFAGACFLNFFVVGTHNTYGVLFVHLLKVKNEGEQKIAWIGSIATCLSMLAGVPAVKFCSATGITITWIVGTVMCSAGIIGTAFASNIYLMYFTYGVLNGLGSCLLYTTCMILLPHLFKKYEALATGVVIASGSCGSLALAPALEYAMSNFGIKATLITEGLAFFCVGTLCSLSYIPIARQENERQMGTTNEVIDKQTGVAESEECVIGNCHMIISHGMQERTEIPPAVFLKADHIDAKMENLNNSPANKNHDRFTLSLRLFKQKEYVLFLVIMVITNFTYYIPLTHLINYAEEFGTSDTKATLLITYWSVSHIIGCATFGITGTRFPTKRLLTYQVAMLLSGMSSVLASVASKYGLLVAYVVVHGFLDGSFSGMQPLVTLDVVGIDDMGQGFGILNCFIAIPCALGPTVVGWINDSKLLPRKSMFYFTGVPFIAGSLLLVLLIKWRPNVRTVKGQRPEGCAQLPCPPGTQRKISA